VSTRLSKLILSLIMASAIAGCSVGPHYKAPVPAPATFHAADSQLVTNAPFDARWWKQFDDPVLDSLMEKALTANNDIRIATARLAESRSVYDQRKLTAIPQFQQASAIPTPKNKSPDSSTNVTR
jgi:outer membrane protein TolC